MRLRARRASTIAAALAGLSLLVSGATVRAGTFRTDGSYAFDPAADATNDFEIAEPDGGVTVVEDATALSGGHVLALAAYQGFDFPVTLPKEARTYRVSVWVRGSETIADFEIGYSDRKDDVAALYPTGRITSDGWVELANDHIHVDGARVVSASVGLFAPADAQADAIEVTTDGELTGYPNGPNPKCDGATDASACAPDQVCMWNECRDAAQWVPPIPEDRDLVADYLGNRLRLLFGPFAERSLDLPAAEIALTQMKLAKDKWSYWNGFTLAVRRLHDGHTSTSGILDFVLDNPRPLSLCFLEGDADLSHAAAPKDPDYLDVLVSHTGADHTLGLHAGDRLVGVDGMHPIAWARSLIGIHWGLPPTSNHATFAELASALRSLVSRYANDIEVVRCDADAGTCGPVETISIADVPFDPPGTPFDRVTCDNRPLRHLPSSPPKHDVGDVVYSGIVNESDAGEKIYGLEWESLYTTNGTDGVGQPLRDAVTTWKNEGARGVILDHRTGFGGTILAPQILWNWTVPKHASDYYVDRQHAEDEQPTVAEGLAIFDAAVQSNAVAYAGSNIAQTTVPVALLLTQDVSASDWLPLGMKGAPKVRLFAPFQTNGGFSTRYAFGYWLSLSFVLAVGDTFVPDGTTHNGRGVEPDVVVLPKQSDLLAGRDSVYEAALAWVRQELAP
jgi:hypothetical protein